MCADFMPNSRVKKMPNVQSIKSEVEKNENNQLEKKKNSVVASSLNRNWQPNKMLPSVANSLLPMLLVL